MKIGDITPWGKADDITVYKQGIYFITTEGHGGFYLAQEYNLMIPLELRDEDGFYEEDEEALKVYVYLFDVIESKLELPQKQYEEWFIEAFGKGF